MQLDSGENLDKAKIIAGFSQQTLSIIGEKIEIFQTIDSTSLEAKRRLSASNANPKKLHGTLLLSEHQSAGRGRLGRSFYSPKKNGIYASLIYGTGNCTKSNAGEQENPKTLPLDPSCITAATAVAVSRALSSFKIETHIKWVNDIFLNGKKICGILTEGVLSTRQNQKNPTQIDTIILGIGINVFETKTGFPDELKNIAGSLNIPISRNELIARVLNNVIEAFSGTVPFAELMKEYRKRSLVLGKNVQIIKPNEKYPATVLNITDEAHLIIERADGSHEELVSGEVSLRI